MHASFARISRGHDCHGSIQQQGPAIRRLLILAAGLLLLVMDTGIGRAQTDLLPDIIVREADLYDHDIVTTVEPGRTHLRLANGTANIGSGRLTLVGEWPPTDSGIVVNQVIDRDDGSSWDRLSGVFIHHPAHLHTHFEGWGLYRLREWWPGDSVGDVVAESEKTSFCIADLSVYDNTLPNFNPNGEFFTCSNLIQGISVGWIDIYSKNLPSQNIDITDIPEGQYWIESIVDPDDHVLESDEANNVARIKILLGGNGTLAPDDYEPNDSIVSVDDRPEGKPNSPNLGPTDPSLYIPGLSIHGANNADYFKFYSNHVGGSGDFVLVNFQHSLGDIDLNLLDSTGDTVGTSAGVSNTETISLNGRAEGWYYIEVFGFDGAINPSYSMTIDPPSNTAPSVTIVDPPLGDVIRRHSFETYTTTWSASDAENNSTWVTVYVNTTPSLDGNEVLLETSVNTPGDVGFHIINSADFPAGSYWVYCKITDGGTTTGAWSDGTVSFVNAVDSDGDGILDFEDNCPYFDNPDQIGCPLQGDPEPDGVMNILDVVRLTDIAFRSGSPYMDASCPHSPAGRTDLNCDGVTNIVDATMIVEVAFRGGVLNFCNPCDCIVYPTDCP